MDKEKLKKEDRTAMGGKEKQKNGNVEKEKKGEQRVGSFKAHGKTV